MSAFLPVLSLIAVVAIGLVITRIASNILRFTGVSPDMARFQARSAFTGCGFTTTESEQLVSHPVRRRVVMTLMLLGNAGFVTVVASLLSIFVAPESESTIFQSEMIDETWERLILVALGLLILWMVSLSKMVDSMIYHATRWAVNSFTRLDIQDYAGLLHLHEGYRVTEMSVSRGHWLTGKNLLELRLADEGIQILGIHRINNEFVGAPKGSTYIRDGDTLIVYGQDDHIHELEQRRDDATGQQAHLEWCLEQEKRMREEEQTERGDARDGDEEPATDASA